jgi:hypothetical protein
MVTKLSKKFFEYIAWICLLFISFELINEIMYHNKKEYEQKG